MSDAPESSAEAGELRALLARLRDVVEAKDTEIAVLREQCRLLELKVAELERRLGQDSTTSGMGRRRTRSARGCGASLEGADRAGAWWSQVWDAKITRFVTEYLLPLLPCPCCGKVNAARPPAGAYPGSIY